jgi:hypothetical protein
VSEVEEPDPDPDEVPIREWVPTPEHPFHAKLFSDDPVWRLWVAGTGTYVVRPDEPAIGVPAAAHPVQREERMWGVPAVLCFRLRGDHSLHAAAVQIGERALAFAAPGRFGKTTMATALVAAGHRLLSEDSTCVRLDPRAVVVPGPAMLRIRPDTFERLHPPDAEVVFRDDDRVHVALDVSRRGDGAPVPLAGIVFLRVADEIAVERVPSVDAIPDLFTLSLHVPTDADRTRAFEAVSRIADEVPIWNLARPLRYDAVNDVIAAVVASCLP